MVGNNELIYEYQQVLLNKSKKIHPLFFSGTALSNENLALSILRYVVECLLRWSPHEVAYKFNKDIIDTFALAPILSYIRIPPEVDESTDFFVYAHKLYPAVIPLDTPQLTLLMYNKVRDGIVKKYPKGFFDDDLGKYRAEICLQYVLSQKEDVQDIPSLYKTFSGPSAIPFLRRHRLTLAYGYSWDSPLDYLHDTLSEIDKHEALYHFYKLKPTMPEFERTRR